MNAFAYANNNPVMKVDADGTEAHENWLTTVVIYMHCNETNETGWHYSMDIAGINFSFGEFTDKAGKKHGRVTVKNGCAASNPNKDDPSSPYMIILEGVLYEDALNGIAYWLNITHGKEVAEEVKSCYDAFSYFNEKGWFENSKLTFDDFKYDFYEFPCIAPIVESLEAMGIKLIWDDCFIADHKGDKKYGYKPHKKLGNSEFRPAYVFRNIYLDQQVTFMRRNADGVFAPY